jgi:predicted MFS family arabinose efflux permease
VVATALLPSSARHFGAARVALTVLPLSAVMGFATPLAPGWVSAAVLTALWGSVYMLVVVNSITYRQQETPDHLMSRVHTCGRMLAFGLGWPAGAFLGGVVAESAGPQAGMLAGAGALVVGVVVAWTSPLRRLARQGIAQTL